METLRHTRGRRSLQCNVSLLLAAGVVSAHIPIYLFMTVLACVGIILPDVRLTP